MECELTFLIFLSLLLMVLGVPLTHALVSVGASVVLLSLLFLRLRRSGLLGRAVNVEFKNWFEPRGSLDPGAPSVRREGVERGCEDMSCGWCSAFVAGVVTDTVGPTIEPA